MGSNYETIRGSVTIYSKKSEHLVYGNIGPLEFYIRTNCPVEAETQYNSYKNRLYVPMEQAKDRVKYGASPSTSISEVVAGDAP